MAKDWVDFQDLSRKVISTGMYAGIGIVPFCFQEDCREENRDWYRSSNTISGDYPYKVHLSNKKWPLKKVS